ncbi:lipoprotein [Mycoplasmopsis californica]|uniref:Lipoprotein n=1 Tax=Mycoplasmopsis californica TaxID=2113 RepID=A0A059XW92_9BACT|nr:leucine-rich repeat domain-containing protein [Mycoplasmopsis californica]AIA29507.1 lipoprotein [Mycoplasmopsis californica]
MKKFRKLFILGTLMSISAPLALSACSLDQTIENDTYVQFRSHSKTELNIPDHVTKIIPSALFLKHKLQKISAKNIFEIPAELFNYATKGATSGLKSVNFPSVQKVEKETFKGLLNLEEVIMPNVVEVEQGAFENTPKLKNLQLGTLTKIADNAFRKTKSLIDTPKFASSITQLPKGIFSESAIKSFKNENITTIGESAFEKSEIEEINLPNVVKVDKGAFAALKLKKINISSNAKIHSEAFGSKSSQAPKELFNNEGLLVFQDTLFLIDLDKAKNLITSKDKIVTLTLPENIKSINTFAFKQHKGKINKIIAPGVKSIDDEDFEQFKKLGISEIVLFKKS